MCKMGVELGKVLAKIILAQPEKPADIKGHDSSVCHHFCGTAFTVGAPCLL